MEPVSIAIALAKATGLTDLIGRKLGGSRGAEIASRVVEAAEIVTGHKDPKAALDAMREDQAKLHELKLRLIELYDTESQREADDRASARAKEIAIATDQHAPMLVKVVPAVLSLGVVGMSFVVFLVLMFASIDSQNKDVVVYVMGALNSAMTMILGYHFGSSKGSKDKDDAIAAMARKS